MSLQSQPSYPISEDTRRIARTAFPKGILYMRMRDELGEIIRMRPLRSCFQIEVSRAESPGRLA